MELLCCLAIVAVLAACAVPAHRAAALRTRRADARIALLHLASLQERHYFQHGRYAASLADLGDATGLARSAEGHYLIELHARAAGQGYVVRAVPDRGGPQAADGDCVALMLEDTGRRSAAGSRRRGSTLLELTIRSNRSAARRRVRPSTRRFPGAARAAG